MPAPAGLQREGWGTVVVCASGPSFSSEDAAAIAAARAENRVRVVVVNESWRRIPTADVLYAHDGKWWAYRIADVRAGFAGELWTQDVAAARRHGLNGIKAYRREGLTREARSINVGGNSGYGAINLAYLFGARRLLLVGFDMRPVDGLSHWHGDHAAPLSVRQPFHAWIPRFAKLAADLKADDVEVVNCSAASALTCFPKASLEDALEGRPARSRAQATRPTRPTMTKPRPLTSIIIPTYNDAANLPRAIASALAQTAPVEVIVVDDGSNDGTRAALAALPTDHRLVIVASSPHRGVAAARNQGIETASGEFVAFLDSDDTIEPTKIAEQLDAFTPEVGFVICDTRIVEPDGRAERASQRYGYAAKGVGGWIAEKLAAGNFIPVHAPLIRREALGDLRFEERELEDWHFWHALASRARCRYLPRPFATYHKRRGSRNATARATPANRPGIEPPLRLNLGCGTPGALSWHPIRGLVNLDKSMGWRFEDGLPDFADGSVAGITVSHALMYVATDRLPFVLGEFARVLRPGGVVRITEDDTANATDPRRRGGWRGSEPAVTLTDPKMMRRALESVGFTVHDVGADETRYADRSLCQAQHGEPPDVFFIEGVREAAVLFAPHADDEALFAAFSMIRYRPRVVVCFPSSGDYGDTAARLEESRAAAAILGSGPVEQWDGLDLVGKMAELDARLRPTIAFAPHPASSHPEHSAVAHAAAEAFGDRLRRFHTYDDAGKVRRGDLVAHEPGWADLKRRALACYRTQREHPRARRFFDDDLAEYLE